MSFSQIPWFLLCGGLTALGLIGSWFALRRRGVRAALRGVAWSLLPIAAYLVGMLQVLWRFGVAIGDFFGGLAFSPKVWSGVIVAAVSLVLFVVTGGLRGRARRKQASREREAKALRAPQPVPGPATGVPGQAQAAPVLARRKGAAPADEDFGDVADILRRHGIK
jgi:heme exporter protein D